MMPTSPGSEVQALPQASHDNPGAYQCSLCPKRFTRAFNLRSHVLSHTNERPFLCTFCGSAFVRHNDRREHEKTHDAAAARHFICQGTLKDGSLWGCGRHFARSTNLARHHRCQKGRACIAAALLEKAHNQACATAHRQSLVPTLSVTPAMPTVAETVYTIVPADNFQPPATGTDSLASYQSHLQVEHRAKILESILTSKGYDVDKEMQLANSVWLSEGHHRTGGHAESHPAAGAEWPGISWFAVDSQQHRQ